MPAPITPTATSTTAATTPKSETPSAFKASSDMFLKLMVENLKHQDPMKPQDSDAYVQQIAQMSTVEQLTDLTNSQKRTETLALLGRQVSFRDATGAMTSGKVEAINTSSGTLTVDGIAGIDPKKVSAVSLPGASSVTP